MPLIRPIKNENQDTFISRFMKNEIAATEFPNEKQRSAIAYSIWENKIDSVDRISVFHIDSSGKHEITAEGYLKCFAYIAKPGILRYDYGDETLDEYFPASECFCQESMDTAKLKPIVMDHGYDGYKYNMIKADNINQYQIGYSGESISKESEFLKVNVLITHKDSIDYILARRKEGKHVELSMGYGCKLIKAGGTTPDGSHYDAVQTQRIYNHISIADKGRAGESVRLKFDKKGDKVMGKTYTKNAIKLDAFSSDAINLSIDENNAPSFDRIWIKFDEAVNAIEQQDSIIKDQNSKHDELQAKYDQAQETIKSQEVKMNDLQNPRSDTFQAILKERNGIEKLAGYFKIDCSKFDNQEAKMNILIKACKNIDPNGKYSKDYINARYDTVVDLTNQKTNNDNNDETKNFMLDSLVVGNASIDPRSEFIKKSQAMHITE